MEQGVVDGDRGPPGDVTLYGESITANDDLMQADDPPLASGTDVWLAWADGHWWVIAAACPASPVGGS